MGKQNFLFLNKIRENIFLGKKKELVGKKKIFPYFEIKNKTCGYSYDVEKKVM